MMEHHEAIDMMAAEKYLLDELTPELKEAYEDHLFGCTECAHDALLGAAFVRHTKVLLPSMQPAKPLNDSPSRMDIKPMKRRWSAWVRPAIMVPVFASLVACIAYQNLAVLPALETAASEPRILPPTTVLHGETRGGSSVVHADVTLGSTVTVELPQNGAYASFKFDLYDSRNKLTWTRMIDSARSSEETLTLWLPGSIKPDSYKLTVSGVATSGQDVLLQQDFFELRINQ